MPYSVTKIIPHPIDSGNQTAILTLEDGYGSIYHIVIDDHCYVLVCERDGTFTPVTHWFEEAAIALHGLPASPNDMLSEIRPYLSEIAAQRPN